MNLYAIGLILTFVGYVFYWLSRFLKTKHGILIVDIISKVVTIASFFCLGSWTGVWGHTASIFREFAALYRDKVKKPLLWLFALVILSRTLVLIFAYEGLPSWMAYITWLLTVVSMWWGTEQQMRLYGAVGNIFYIAFQFLVLNWVGLACEVVVLICNVSSFMYYKKKATKKARRKGKAHAKSTSKKITKRKPIKK